MGEVYQAHDPNLDRDVALKILPPELIRNEDRVRRFEQEARSASGLSHPHIVTIHEVGEARIPVAAGSGEGDGDTTASIRYITMELVDGTLLKNRIHRERADLKHLVRWISQVAEGLAKAHAAGIIHRDLKPENIMITSDGYAKVLDFGLAKLTETIPEGTNAPTAVRDQTGEGVVLGTVGYMSPEQVQGKKIDARSDIFSLGCILYEAAAGERPFTGATPIDVMHSILHDKPRPIHEIRPEVPAELRRLIRRCLSKDSDRRYQSVKDVALELAEMVEEWDELTGEGSAISSSGSGGLAPISYRRTRGIVLILAPALAVMMIVAAVLLSRQKSAVTKRASAIGASFVQLTSDRGIETQPSISPDGNFVVYASPASGNWDLYLLRIGGQNPINLTASSDTNDTHPAFSPDGDSIAFRSERGGGGIFVMGATGESVRRLTDFGHDPAWSPDGTKIVIAGESPPSPYARVSASSLWTVDASSGRVTKISDGDAVQPAWSPDGRWIALWGLPNQALGHRELGLLPSLGGEIRWITTDEALDWNPMWSPDGRFLYFSSDRGGTLGLWRLDLDDEGIPSGDPVPITTPSRWSGYLSVASDGKRILFTAVEVTSNIEAIGFDPISRRATGQSRSVTRRTSPIADLSVSPDGSWIAYRTAGGREDLFVVGIDGTGVRRLTDDAAKDRGTTWHPDGERIVFYSDRGGRYEIWMINRDGSGLQKVTETSGRSYWFPRISPEGHRLVTFNENGTVLFDLSQPLPVKTAERLPPVTDEGKELAFYALDWSPSGARLIGVRGDLGLGTLGLSIYSIAERSYRHLSPVSRRSRSELSWSPDESGVIMSTEGEILFVDTDSGRQTILHSFAPGSFASNATLSSDGREIFYIHGNEQADLWIADLQE